MHNANDQGRATKEQCHLLLRLSTTTLLPSSPHPTLHSTPSTSVIPHDYTIRLNHDNLHDARITLPSPYLCFGHQPLSSVQPTRAQSTTSTPSRSPLFSITSISILNHVVGNLIIQGLTTDHRNPGLEVKTNQSRVPQIDIGTTR